MNYTFRLLFCAAISVWSLLAYGQNKDQLVHFFEQEVSPLHKISVSDEQFKVYSTLLSSTISRSDFVLDTPQYIILIDRAVNVQLGMIIWHDVLGDSLIGAAKVSTGTYNRKGYYITPVGVFRHGPENHDFRAQGTKNSNGIRGYGSKGMRVFDFGWQSSIRGWGNGSDKSATIRLAMHATDPDVLEARLGTPASKGCVRIPSTMNKFIDHYGLIDAAYYEQYNSSWLATPGTIPIEGAGKYMVVVDSSTL